MNDKQLESARFQQLLSDLLIGAVPEDTMNRLMSRLPPNFDGWETFITFRFMLSRLDFERSRNSAGVVEVMKDKLLFLVRPLYERLSGAVMETLVTAQLRVADLNTKIRNRPLDINDCHGLLHHLKEEIVELTKEFYDTEHFRLGSNLKKEAADVLVLLLAFCQARGIDLAEAFEEKMKINERREWQPPDDKGVIRHESRRKDVAGVQGEKKSD